MSISLDSLFSRVANNYGVDNLKPDSYGKQNSATYNDNFIDLRNNNEEDKTYLKIILAVYFDLNLLSISFTMFFQLM